MRARGAVLALVLAAAGPAGAQQVTTPAPQPSAPAPAPQPGTPAPQPAAPLAPAPAPAAVLLIDTERLFLESAYGQQLRAAIEAEAEALNAENERIVAELTAEERRLTERRPTMEPEAFRAEAAAFDARVQDIRRERDARESALQLARSNASTQFFERVRPIVGQLMIERGASTVIDSRSVFVTVRSVDITQAAVARIDAELATPPADDAN